MKTFLVRGKVLALVGGFGSDVGVGSAFVGPTGMPQAFRSHCTLHVILHSFRNFDSQV